ncbi:hypothetical protein ACIBI0_38525 [Microbispora rosea]|uniref:hypothetical protein n=1 Tax=Microbispora rosea TaxID=58117 RepID=UPI003795E052
MDPSFVMVLVVVGAIVALRALYKYRLKVCPKCTGTGKVYSSLFSRRFMGCPRCSRKGEVRGAFGSPD